MYVIFTVISQRELAVWLTEERPADIYKCRPNDIPPQYRIGSLLQEAQAPRNVADKLRTQYIGQWYADVYGPAMMKLTMRDVLYKLIALNKHGLARFQRTNWNVEGGKETIKAERHNNGKFVSELSRLSDTLYHTTLARPE